MGSRNRKGPWVITIIAFLLATVILALGYRSFKATEKTAFNEFNQRQLVLARATAGGIELYFENLAGDMKAVARTPGVQHFDEAPARREIQYMLYELEPWGVNDVAVLDAKGVVRYNVMAPQIEGVDFSWRRYYQEAKTMTSDDDTYIIEFIEFKGVEAGQKGVLIAVPMFETAADSNYPPASGQFAGLAVCTLKLDTITERFVAPVRSSQRGHAFLIDDEYNVLWAPGRSLFGKNLLEEGDGFPAFQQVVERMRVGNAGVAEYSYYRFEDSVGEYTGDEEEKFMAFAPIRLGRKLWAIGVWAPKEDARLLIRSAYLQQLMVVGFSILTILAGFSCALGLSFRLSKSLEKEVEAKTGELKEAHERLLMVLDSLDAAVYVADMETYEILFANEYLRDLFGDVVGKPCWQTLQVGQSSPCDFCTNEKLLTTDGEPGGVYVWTFRNTVTGLWYEVRDRAIRWVDGRIVRLEISIDVTERKRVEEALRESELRYRTTIDAMGDPIHVIDTDLRFILFNATFRRWNKELDLETNVIGRTVFEVFPFLPDSVRDEYHRVFDTGETLITEESTKLGSREFITETRKIPVFESGRVTRVITIIRDITERKRAEEALQQYAERLRALTARLAEVSEAERQQLARELHDQVGQNLTALGINLNIVRTHMPEEAAALVRSRLDDSLSLMEQTTERIRNVMADLRPPVLDDYGLVAALHWYGEQFARWADIAVTVEGEELVPRLAAPVENALFRIAQEALTNVAKHAQAAQVTLTVEADSGTMRLIVADDGIGFDTAHLIEPDGSRGWGLLTMTERAEAVGGRCCVESYPGQGARVIVEVAR